MACATPAGSEVQLANESDVPTGSRDRADVRDVVLDQHQLHVLLRDAAQEGASRALADIGLENGTAREDVAELRGLARAVQTIRSTILRTITRAMTILILGILIGSAAMKLNLTKIFKPLTGQ